MGFPHHHRLPEVNIPASIFTAYDVRGVYPTDLNEERARWIIRALVQYTGAKTAAVGRDNRVSSPSLASAVIDELVQLGLTVDDLGLMSTDAMYYISSAFDYDAVVMVTASHNPAAYNGLKMLQGKAEFIRGKLLAVEVAARKFAQPKPGGKSQQRDLLPAFVDHLLSLIDRQALKPLKVVIDAGHGMAGKVMPLLAPKLPFAITTLYADLDGRFPERPPNPKLPGALDKLKATVREQGADVGVAFDGDCDRVFFVDEQGEFIQADLTLLLLAEPLLRQRPGRAIVFNAICSRSVPETVQALGGKPIRVPVGYANMREAAVANDALIGGEDAGHYIFADNSYLDSGFVAMLRVLEILSRSSQPLSALIRRYHTYCRLDEVNLKVADVHAELQKVRDHFTDAKLDELDGVTVQYPDWWVNVRPSNTEPLLRVTLEGKTRELAEAKLKDVLGVLGK